MTPWRVIEGDCRAVLGTLEAGSAQTCVTSPPYFGLRDYGHDGQIGLEPTPDEFVAALVEVFRDVRRVLRDDGTLWLNLGDSYGDGKQLLGVPWRVALALQTDGWILRSDIIWAKPNAMPESVTDRPTSAHEHLFLFAKSGRYFYDVDAIREPHLTADDARNRDDYEPRRLEAHASIINGGARRTTRGAATWPEGGRNRRSVWTVATQVYSGAHFATFPPKLIEPCILAGSKPGDVVLDPFNGAGTTGMVALRHGRSYVGIELNAEYAEMSRWRIKDDAPLLNGHTEYAA